jgi:hypothetical protein
MIWLSLFVSVGMNVKYHTCLIRAVKGYSFLGKIQSGVRVKRYLFSSAVTGFCNEPRPSIVTTTLSPGNNGPTPAGVPVIKMSPGFRVITDEA